MCVALRCVESDNDISKARSRGAWMRDRMRGGHLEVGGWSRVWRGEVDGVEENHVWVSWGRCEGVGSG